MSDPSTPTPDRPAGADGPDPSLLGTVSGLLTTVVLWALTYFALPVDDTTKLIVAGVVGVIAPIVCALVIRLRAWEPASVAKLQDDFLRLVEEARAGSPTVVAREPMTPVQAAEAHPGALGLSGPGDEEADLAVGTEDGLPGRHIKRKDQK